MHTLGKWTIAGRHIISRTPEGDLLNCDGIGDAHDIATVFGPDAPDNACLIAAAPRLLAACEAVYEWARNPDVSPLDEVVDVLELVRDALRAAGVDAGEGERHDI